MIRFTNLPEGSKVLELGGGDNPQPITTCNVDVRQGKRVNFVVNFEEFPWPIKDDEWPIVLSIFCLEHISWRLVTQTLKEIHRIMQPGGKLVVVVPNTEAQMKYILAKPEWDGDEGSMLFGGQDYGENAHKSAWSPRWATKIFSEAGFENIIVSPYTQNPQTRPGDETDMLIECSKPQTLVNTPKTVQVASEDGNTTQGVGNPPEGGINETNPTTKEITQTTKSKQGDGTESASYEGNVVREKSVPSLLLTSEGRRKCFDRRYFSGGSFCGGYKPFYMDFPCHEMTVQNILRRKPQSVLELGCGRGYLIKRLEDRGVDCFGIDISTHCELTRATSRMALGDLCEGIVLAQSYDLAVSIAVLDHIPEQLLPRVMQDLATYSKRGYHGINFNPPDSGDLTRVTIKPKEWWQGILPPGHEVVTQQESEQGEFPPHYFEDGGLTKVNIGCAWSMLHQGWHNLDILDLKNYAQQSNYKFTQCDLRQGIPFGTEVVNCFFLSHVLEHFTFKEILAILKDLRRAIRPDGVVRIIVPDVEFLTTQYQEKSLGFLDQLQSECEEAKTQAMKLNSLLVGDEHKSLLDEETLGNLLSEAKFTPRPTKFRTTQSGDLGKLILCETIDAIPCLSLFMEAVPTVG